VEEIFDNKVGNPYGTQDEIDKINRQAEMRYKLKIPPGYQDDGKDKDGPDEFCHNGLIYKRKYGDYFVWSQMLSYTADQEIKQLIFITDDGKDDWWCQVDFGGSKTIGPRAELNEEVARLGKVETFLMYKPEGFLKYANEFLHAEISQETLTEVHDVSLENKLKFLTIEEMHSQDVQALASVLSWVEGKYDLAFFNDEEFPDIFGLTDIEFHGYKVNLFRGRSPALYRDILLKSVGAMAKQAMSSLTIVFIARTAGEARMVMNALERVSNVNAPDNLYICIGSIDSSHGNQFDPIHEFGFNSIAHY
ncbi:PIN-like domain-containing protein, partial [Pseudomonas viridiflava]